jgi:predicted nucleic-acid-binding Zn-ribbon protein
MQAETIKTGKCPVCGSAEVYDNRDVSTANQRKFILVSATKSFSLDAYVCISCGYFKEFIREEDMKNEKLMAKTKDNWNKTGTHNIKAGLDNA